MSNAQVQAQSLASAAGYIVGRVLAISSTTSQGAGACTATVKFGVGSPGVHAIEITSSRTVTSVPDQVVISITENTAVNAQPAPCSRCCPSVETSFHRACISRTPAFSDQRSAS